MIEQFTNPPAVVQTLDVVETEQELVTTAKSVLSACNWTVGECAAKWTMRFARGRSDSDFGQLVGLSGDQVYQRRRVWEQFADVKADYPACKWTHFYVALTWPDAAECLAWANENEATIAEMKAWRRMQNGDDLTVDADAPNQIGGEPDDESETCDTLDSVAESTAGLSASVVPPLTAPDRDPAEKPYAPFRADDGSPPRDRTRQAPEKPRRQQDAEDACRKQLTAATKLARSVDPRYAAIVAEHLDRLAECLRQGETGKKVTGLDAQNIRYLFKQVSE